MTLPQVEEFIGTLADMNFFPEICRRVSTEETPSSDRGIIWQADNTPELSRNEFERRKQIALDAARRKFKELASGIEGRVFKTNYEVINAYITQTDPTVMLVPLEEQNKPGIRPRLNLIKEWLVEKGFSLEGTTFLLMDYKPGDFMIGGYIHKVNALLLRPSDILGEKLASAVLNFYHEGAHALGMVVLPGRRRLNAFAVRSDEDINEFIKEAVAVNNEGKWQGFSIILSKSVK